jgi:hypothetical protein
VSQNVKTRHAMPCEAHSQRLTKISKSLCFFVSVSLLHARHLIGGESGRVSQALTEAWSGSRSQPLSSWQNGRKSVTAEESANPISNVDLV